MELADSKSRIEWFNRCCELQNALGQADKQLKTYEAEIDHLTAELVVKDDELAHLTRWHDYFAWEREMRKVERKNAKLRTAIRKHLQTDDVFYLEKALEGKP